MQKATPIAKNFLNKNYKINKTHVAKQNLYREQPNFKSRSTKSQFSVKKIQRNF